MRVNTQRFLSHVCGLIDVPADRVRSITCTPTSVEIVVFALNEEGKKYIRTDTGEVAVDTRVLEAEPWRA